MNLINFENISLGFGGDLLLDEVNFRIKDNERIGLIGRNGMGKTSLMKLINGDLTEDSGIVSRQQGLRIAYLPQEVPQELSGTIYEIVKNGLADMVFDWSEEEMEWQSDLLVQKTLSRMQLLPEMDFDVLSAGMKRRVLLAKGLVAQPQLLLLDEPTNHLDIQSILWLEDFLLRWNGSLIFVTHDRVFLQKLTTRIVELDRGKIFDWDCDYPTFLLRKEAYLNAEQTQNALFDRKLAQEEQWIRKGIEARRTRNEGRVRALQKLREIRKERREKPGKVNLQIQEARKSGKLVIEAEDVSFGYSDQLIIRDFSFILQRGDKLGIVGPNGSGKTTLVNLLIGNLKPLKGLIQFGTNLEWVYFDQLRSQLDENQTLYENVAQGRDTIAINGQNRNVYGYLEDFLFTKERVHAPIHVLSGGERNRLLLARLFTMPANLLILDEPTNDLDLETLELLENLLLDFKGTFILVSHDRAFLNNLVTSTLVLEGDGLVREYIGGYDDWYQQSQEIMNKTNLDSETSNLSNKNLTTSEIGIPKKLNFMQKKKLQEELEQLPGKIELLESEYQQTIQKMSSSEFYNQDEKAITETASRLKWIEDEIAHTYQRWQDVEHLLADNEN
ncbi:MAG: ABC transporter ATP-binding protein [Chloroflexi bacterium HGW-Chloroflexi-2]|jgi:ATP-binding cassette subfamily F protein uup|nr:MAG: ABC transporter ATP-binding protein [Chloroflexi bacterium HGW-Chloroflexi-2]